MQLEPLETRDTPAAFVGLSGGTLAVVCVGGPLHGVALERVGDIVHVTADGAESAFPAKAVAALVVVGDPAAPNFVLDKVDVPALLVGGSRSDVIVTVDASAMVLPGGGVDLVVHMPALASKMAAQAAAPDAPPLVPGTSETGTLFLVGTNPFDTLVPHG